MTKKKSLTNLWDKDPSGICHHFLMPPGPETWELIATPRTRLTTLFCDHNSNSAQTMKSPIY